MFGMMGFFKSALSAFCVIALSTTFVGLATAQSSPTGGGRGGVSALLQGGRGLCGGRGSVRGRCRSVQCRYGRGLRER